MKKTFLWLGIIAPFFSALMISLTVIYLYSKPIVKEDTPFTIKTGTSFSRLNQQLYDQSLINNTRLFHYLAKFKGVINKFQAGTFLIKKDSNTLEVLDLLVHGNPMLTSITIPEGKNMYEIAEILASEGVIKQDVFLKETKKQKYLKKLNIQADNLEGFLFPETYHFSESSQASTVVSKMIQVFKDKTKDIDFTHPFLTRFEIITLASVVEKETGAKFERPIIAGVFLNRLKKKMRLQSDPTTIYGIWDRYNGNLRKRHLLEKNEYNTYKMSGLPKGPISNPSLAAIKAVLKPKKHRYLYFVSKNDGTHIFTKSYKEHKKAVENWQKNARNRRGKSWRDLKQN